MLYLVATPIGNLKDISFRAIEILSNCQYILTEDTRRSSILLNHYNIKKPLISFHKFNEKKQEAKIIEDLKNNLDIALISDGGTPLISDPGSRLVNACIKENLPFTTVPGACSLIQALLLSGFETSPFQFLGFFQKKLAKKVLNYDGVSIFFESPYRLLKTLTLFANLDPELEVAVVREITKIYEECKRGKISDIQKIYSSGKIRGEIIVLIRKNLC